MPNNRRLKAFALTEEHPPRGHEILLPDHTRNANAMSLTITQHVRCIVVHFPPKVTAVSSTVTWLICPSQRLAKTAHHLLAPVQMHLWMGNRVTWHTLNQQHLQNLEKQRRKRTSIGIPQVPKTSKHAVRRKAVCKNLVNCSWEVCGPTGWESITSLRNLVAEQNPARLLFVKQEFCHHGKRLIKTERWWSMAWTTNVR